MDILSYVQPLVSLHVDLLSYVGGFLVSFGLLLSLVSVFYIGTKIWSSYAHNEMLDLWALGRPFVIAYICVNFVQVTSIIEGACAPISYFGQEFYNKGAEVQKKAQAAYTKRVQAVEREANMKKHSAAKKTSAMSQYAQTMTAARSGGLVYYDQTGDIQTSVNMESGQGIVEFLLWLVAFIVSIIKYTSIILLMCSRAITLFLLSIFGPLAFTLSLVPGWSKNIMSWVGKYVSVLLWLPILYLILGVFGFIEAGIFATFTGAEKIGLLNSNLKYSIDGTILNIDSIRYIIDIALALSIMTIPNMASWFIPESAQSAMGASDAKGVLTITAGITGVATGYTVATGYALTKSGVKSVVRDIRASNENRNAIHGIVSGNAIAEPKDFKGRALEFGIPNSNILMEVQNRQTKEVSPYIHSQKSPYLKTNKKNSNQLDFSGADFKRQFFTVNDDGIKIPLKLENRKIIVDQVKFGNEVGAYQVDANISSFENYSHISLAEDHTMQLNQKTPDNPEGNIYNFQGKKIKQGEFDKKNLAIGYYDADKKLLYTRVDALPKNIPLKEKEGKIVAMPYYLDSANKPVVLQYDPKTNTIIHQK